jgi:hypothetical protein
LTAAAAPSREAGRVALKLRGHSTSDLWLRLPEGLSWPELDEIRAEHLRVRGQVAAELAALSTLGARFRDEDQQHDQDLRQAQRDANPALAEDRLRCLTVPLRWTSCAFRVAPGPPVRDTPPGLGRASLGRTTGGRVPPSDRVVAGGEQGHLAFPPAGGVGSRVAVAGYADWSKPDFADALGLRLERLAAKDAARHPEPFSPKEIPRA